MLRIPVAGAPATASSSSSSSSAEGEAGVVRLGVFNLRVVANGYSHFVSRQHHEDGTTAAASGVARGTDGAAAAVAGGAVPYWRGSAHLAVHVGWGGSTKQVRLHSMRDAMW